MNKIKIQPATNEDKQWAAELMAYSEPWTILGITVETCRDNTFDTSNRIFIIRINNDRCGMIILQDKGVAGSPYIKSVVVSQKYRSQGIGKEVLQFAENFYKQTSRYLFLCVSSFNEKAQKFYIKNDWQVIGELKDYIVDGYSEILMYKKLR